MNRMSFWMATGSGKTLVIVKLLELLGYLIQNNKIPKKDILFLTYRDDLIEQFKKHVDEFNQTNSLQINLIKLKEYSSRKQNPIFSFGNIIDVYYYRSDLISDEQKDKIVSYKNYENYGNWYIILDEAHKGDREDSKRQIFYSILCRNGFMFNFSATFTDERDFATCAYNFNLARFIEDGYGKHIYISQENIKALESKNNVLLEQEKQKILLKILLLQTAINQQYKRIKEKYPDKNLYHKPLLLTLVNSVNINDSDLEMFFKEIEKIATGNGDVNLLNNAKEEIQKELDKPDAKFEFEGIHLDKRILNVLESIQFNDILESVFNSKTTGTIEVLKIPSNKQELIFKLKTSSQPFALMKIGDITEWIKNKLTGYEIIEKFDNESIFENINHSEDINILMGSRSFYEGWDSNRPNLILFINIGKGTDAKKFVLQSIGRGVRIEPIPNKRKRAQFLYNNKELDSQLYTSIKDTIEPLETLFVFGTKADNLEEIIKTMKQEKPEVLLGDLFEINPDVKDKLLLIPTYKYSDKIIVEEQNVVKYPIHSDDYNNVKEYFNYLGDKTCLAKYDCNLKVLQRLKDGFNGKANDYFLISKEEKIINNPDFILRQIFRHFENKLKEFSDFKKLEEEIIHFKRIHISAEKLNALREKIEKVKKAKYKNAIINELKEKLDKKEIDIDEYTSQIENITTNLVKEAETTYSSNEKLKIKLLNNHYYLPVMLTESERAEFIQHIIKHKSEVDFIKELENHLQQENNFFKQFDWWYFSKIDETLDEVYIPYYNPKENKIANFNPDFIFWLKPKKIEKYLIVFIDPKATTYADANYKIDGYKKIFEENNKVKVFPCKTIVKLFMWGKNNTGAEYANYWTNSFDNFANKINSHLQLE
ncbi:MAG: restriction endonuclease subunit R [Thermodesulfobium narugense]|nr:MAG: restriction endonuclease subunit R [Thermodesulfobium narugense]